MEFADLSRIAKGVAAGVDDVDMRGDVVQEAWCRFAKYPPHTYQGAWLMARSARTSLFRREQYQMKIMDALPPEPTFTLDSALEARGRLRELAAQCPRAFAFMLHFIMQPRHSGADRRMACYYRQQLRAVNVG